MEDDEEYFGKLMERARQEHEYHELSTVFSSFEDTEEFKKLVDDIKVRGLDHPILLWQGKIVDGRHRHKACLLAGVEPHYEYLPDSTPLQAVMNRVVAENILRRHLTTGQRAMIAAALANMTAGGGGNQYTKVDRANLPDAKSNADAAKSLSVSERAVKDAKEVKRDAPDLAEKVSRGEMTLNAAKTQSRERRGESPKSTSAPAKPTSLSLDEMMKVGGDNWDSFVAAGALVSTVRDLHLQEGDKGMIRSIMHFIESGEGKHSQSYNAAGLVALYKSLGGHIDELEALSQYKPTETQIKH
jgi:ParB-like chromosome segregation protein Spo0J